MQLVALRDWYPRFGDWTGTLVPQSDRIGFVVHHTVGGTNQDPEAYARAVADYHYGKWGVPGGYNYLVGEDGVVRVMCGLAFRGVHSGTHEWNYKSLGLAFQGDFRTHQPSDLMLDAARELIAETPVPADQWGHRDVRPEPTTCPGQKLYDLLPLEVDMSAYGPENWDAADWAAFDNRGGKAAWAGGYTILGRHPNTVLRSIEAKVDALDVEGLSEAEMDERVDRIVERINAQPAAFIAKLKSKL